MDILRSIEASITPSQINSLSSLLGETPDATERAMTGAIPALLGGVVRQGGTQQGAVKLIETMKVLPSNGAMTDLLGRTDDKLSRSGSTIVSQLFNGQMASVANLIGSYSGMRSGSVQNLMTISAPMVLGSVAREAPSGGFSAQGLMGLLDSQKPYILRAIPSGLTGLLSLIGLGNIRQAAQTQVPTTQQTTRVVERTVQRPYDERRVVKESGGWGWLPWALITAALAAFALFGVKTCTQRTAVAPTAVSTVTLPSGGTLGVRTGSIGDQLYHYLSTSAPAPRTFTFDNLEFNSAQATYTPSSQPTIDGITSLLKAYPNTVVRIDGFTDATGDVAGNLSLSQARANTVANALIAGGVAASRVTAIGNGEAQPIASNSTDAGRAKNRRIELTVTQK